MRVVSFLKEVLGKKTQGIKKDTSLECNTKKDTSEYNDGMIAYAKW